MRKSALVAGLVSGLMAQSSACASTRPAAHRVRGTLFAAHRRNGRFDLRRVNNGAIKVIVASALLLGAAAGLAITIAPPPPREYVCQTWVALSTEDDYSMRVTLSPDGSGAGVLLRYDKSPEPFKVTSWNYEEYSLTLSVHFKNREIDISRMNGAFKRPVLSYISGMLPNPEPLSAKWLPGPLELSFQGGEKHFRFGAWPERDLQATVDALEKASP